jgi:hypothetical protein
MLDPTARKDYMAFLRYAAGPGQQQGVNPGQLPVGMVPLPEALKAQTLAAATTIETQTNQTPTGPSPTSSSLPTTGATTTKPTASPTDHANPAATTGGTATNSGGSGSAASPTGATPHSGGPSVKTPTPVQQPVASLRRTPSLVAPAVGGLFLAILICTVLAAANPPVMHLLRTSPPVRYLLGAAARRRPRKEVTPTER